MLVFFFTLLNMEHHLVIVAFTSIRLDGLAELHHFLVGFQCVQLAVNLQIFTTQELFGLLVEHSRYILPKLGNFTIVVCALYQQ